MKINVDASFCYENMTGGMGAIARDDRGEFIAAASWFIPHVASAESAEMMAIRNGFYLASRIGCSSFQIESDCSNAVQAFNLEDYSGQDSAIVLEGKEMGLDFAQYEIIACLREANDVADSIAKFSLSSRSSEVWESSIPDFISQLVVNDLAII